MVGGIQLQRAPSDTDDAQRAAAYRLIAERCIYGVDLNHLAVELAKLSLWLVTLSKDQPFTFLDHRLRHGNSLIGASFFAETTVDLRKRYATEYEKVGTVADIRHIEFIPDAALKARRGSDKATKKKARSRIKGNQQVLPVTAQVCA